MVSEIPGEAQTSLRFRPQRPKYAFSSELGAVAATATSMQPARILAVLRGMRIITSWNAEMNRTLDRLVQKRTEPGPHPRKWRLEHRKERLHYRWVGREILEAGDQEERRCSC